MSKLATFCLVGAAFLLSTEGVHAQGKNSPLSVSKPALLYPLSSDFAEGPEVTFRWSKPKSTTKDPLNYALTITGAGVDEIIQPLTDTFYTFTKPMQEGEFYDWYILAWAGSFGGNEFNQSDHASFIKGTNEGTSAGVKPAVSPLSLTEISAYPNPSVSKMQLSFTLAEPSAVSVALYNTMGVKQSVAVHSQMLGAGMHSTVLNVSSLPAGIYTVVISTPQGIASKPIQILK